MKLVQWFKRGFVIVLIGVIVVYAGACVYANWMAGDGTVKLPTIEKAAYAVQIEGTGQILFTNKVTENGTYVTLKGYFEYRGKKYIYKKATLNLDEKLFGEIRIVKRQTD